MQRAKLLLAAVSILLCCALDACSGDTAMHVAPHGSDDGGVPKPVCVSCGGCEQSVKITSVNHVSGVIAYTDLPPAGGDHNACWASWGVHAQPVGPEHWVHNLEHGGVVFLYHCTSDCTAEVAQLQKLVDGRTQALLTAYDQLPGRFAVVAWGHRLVMSCLDTKAMLAFYAAHVAQAPESITSDPPSGCP